MKDQNEINRFKPETEFGKRFQKMAIRYLKVLQNQEKAMEALKDAGLFNEDGSPNSVFYSKSEEVASVCGTHK